MFQRDFFIIKIFGQVSYRIRMFSFIFLLLFSFSDVTNYRAPAGAVGHITQRHANKHRFKITFSIHSWLYLYISLILVDVTC